MTDTNTTAENTAQTGWGGLDSTYVRTIVCINNTYVRTDLLESNTLDFGRFVFGKINAYSITLSRGWW